MVINSLFRKKILEMCGKRGVSGYKQFVQDFFCINILGKNGGRKGE